MPFKSAAEVEAKSLPLLVNMWGEPKTGKTSFLMSFPRPLWLFDFDHGFRELLLMHPEWREGLYYQSYHLPANPTLEQGEEVLQQFLDDWYEAVEAPGGTVGLDTGTDLKSLVTFVKMTQKLEEKVRKMEAKAGKKVDPDTVQLMRPDYAARNEFLRAVLALPALKDDKNAVYLWKAKEKYTGNGQATGTFEGDLFKDAPYIAQATLGRRRIGMKGNVSFSTIVDDCRVDPTLNGAEYPEDVVSGYADLREMLLP
jgi:catechol 2,3-dioxygenase-like lactoylglutathione lyase family enzyme